MATTPNKANPVPATASAAAPQYVNPISGKKVSTGKDAPRGNQTFLFDKSNYMWLFIGLACIFLGFILMSGGKSPDPHKFNADEIYSARRITIAPLLILIGFGIEAYAIMKKPAAAKENNAA